MNDHGWVLVTLVALLPIALAWRAAFDPARTAPPLSESPFRRAITGDDVLIATFLWLLVQFAVGLLFALIDSGAKGPKPTSPTQRQKDADAIIDQDGQIVQANDWFEEEKEQEKGREENVDADPIAHTVGQQRHTSLFLFVSVANLLGSAVILVLLSWRSGYSLVDLGLTPPNGRDLSIGARGLWAWGPLAMVVHGIANLTLTPGDPHPARELLEGDWTWLAWTSLALTAVVSAPWMEELFCRGLLQRWLSQRIGATMGIALSSLAFAMLHFKSWPDPAPLFVLSIGIGRSFQQSGSLWSPIAFHALFNGVMIAVGTLTSRAT